MRRAFNPGPGGRPDAGCPRCGSLERQRFLAMLLDVLAPLLPPVDVLLDIAPSEQTTQLFQRLDPRVHTRVDLGADNRLVDVLGSITALPYRDNCADLLVCYHVLEHVPDDLSAMRELTRVIKPDGVGLVQVPFRRGTMTDEDPSVTDEAERIRRFGQADHVRYYGDDFEDRLVKSGLGFRRVTPRTLLGMEMCTWLRLNPDEVVWIVSPAEDASVPPRLDGGPTAMARTLDALLGELATQHARLMAARARVGELEADNARLRRVLGPALKARRALRRLGGRSAERPS